LIHLAGIFNAPGLSTRTPAEAFPELKNWNKSDETREFLPENLFDYIDGAADSYLSYEFRHLWVKEYNNKKGALIRAEIYEHRNEKDAFGIYSIYLKGDDTFQLFLIQGENTVEYREILESYLKFAQQDPSMVSEGLLMIPDHYNGDVYVIWRGNLNLGTVECTEEAVCVGYLKDFESNLINK
jgi:hypothetical protein